MKDKRLDRADPVPGRSFLLIRHGQPAKYYCNDDELIFIDRQVFHETDMRFRFQEIQAVWISPSRHFVFTACFILASIVFFLFLAASIAQGVALDIGLYFGAGSVGLCAFLLALHLRLGPSCNVTLQTRAHRVKLRSINRHRHAQRFMQTLLPKIQAAQESPSAPTTASDATEI